jgi:predicted nucleotidyltransferase
VVRQNNGGIALLELSRARNLFSQVACVVEAVLQAAQQLHADRIMIVGAWCRDILHTALGHSFATAATHDLDLALALSSWDAYSDLAASFVRAGNSGIRFRIANTAVDLLPFGEIERPPGFVEPPSRGEAFSVWALEEVFSAAFPLDLSNALTIRIPTIACYAATKIGAWLDRCEWHEVKDGADLALVVHWYAESPTIHDRLYGTPGGNEILLAEGTDVPLAAAHLLGADVAATIGSRRQAELMDRWPSRTDLLAAELRLRGGPSWPPILGRRSELVDALTRGLST